MRMAFRRSRRDLFWPARAPIIWPPTKPEPGRPPLEETEPSLGGPTGGAFLAACSKVADIMFMIAKFAD